jgi:hypothetical protein
MEGQMTDEQINAAIAKATDCAGHGNYTHDLNAMHEAEATLTEDQLWIMARQIERNDEQWYFRATARQRAEAFLRTLDKWEDSK